MDVLNVVFTVLEALLALNLLIFVHELGHFLAARWRGLQVDRFAIWFGNPIWKKKINGVEYALGWIPAGGYVALPQMATMEAIEGKSESSGKPLPPISALDKIIVAFFGPLFSLMLAFAFACVVWKVGKPEMSGKESTTIGWLDPDGPAAKAGLQPGDRIIQIDGHIVTQFGSLSQDSITWRIVTSEGTNIAIKYVRDGQEAMAYPVPFKRHTEWYERKALRQVLLSPERTPVIVGVVSNSPAEMAGLQTNDEVIAINGKKIYAPEAFYYAEAQLTNGPIKPVTFTIRHGTNEFDKVLLAETPVKPADATPSFGMWVGSMSTNEVLSYPRPVDQVADSAGQILATVGTIISKKSDVGVQQLGGPIMIIRVYKTFFESENGWRRVLWFSVVLNVNLALLNILPLPVLDGGHILLALIEVARRRPVSARLMNFIQTGFAMALIMFMLFIAFFDLGDWIRTARADRDVDIVFSPKK